MKVDDTLRALAASPSSAAGNPGAPAADGQAWRRQMERAQADAWFHGFAGTRASAAGTPTDGSAAQKVQDTRPEQHSAARPAAGGRASMRLTHPRGLAEAGPAHGSGQTGATDLNNQVLPAAYRAVDQAASIPLGARSMTERVAQPGLPRVSWSSGGACTDLATVTPPMRATASSPRISLTIVEPSAASDSEIDIGGPAAAVRDTRLESTRLPVHVHVEGDKRQPTVWLGLDAQAAIHLPEVTRAVAQWLAQSGYGQARWVCNGQPFGLNALPGSRAELDERPSPSAEPFPLIEHLPGESG